MDNKWVQSRLTSFGFPVGVIDGVIGPITIAALKAFQKAHGLPQTGAGDVATMAVLAGSSSAGGAIVRPPVVPVWPVQGACMAYYGNVGTRQTAIEIPFEMRLAWDKSVRVKKITVHELVAASARLVFEEVAQTYNDAERTDLGLNIFGGSLNVRKMRGGTSWSMHSWGIAIDFDPERNGLNVHSPQARLSHPDATAFWLAWERQGWISLGRQRNFDWMHVQAARL